jgi:hypothetical protein
MMQLRVAHILAAAAGDYSSNVTLDVKICCATQPLLLV